MDTRVSKEVMPEGDFLMIFTLQLVVVIVYVFQIEQKCAELQINGSTTVKLMDLVLKELNSGLSKKGNANADLKCFITYIKDLPNGKGSHVRTN